MDIVDGMIYTGTYRVVKIHRNSCRRKVLERGLTREEAKRVVMRHPDSQRSIVVFEKQFYSKKYFKELK